jgi:hypothetical protein
MTAMSYYIMMRSPHDPIAIAAAIADYFDRQVMQTDICTYLLIRAQRQ